MANWLREAHAAEGTTRVEEAQSQRVRCVLTAQVTDLCFELEDVSGVIDAAFHAQRMAVCVLRPCRGVHLEPRHEQRRRAHGDERSPLHARWGGLCPPLALTVAVTDDA